MKRTFRLMAIAAPAALMLAACTPPNSGNLVDANQAQRAQTVNFGTVVSVQSVNVQGGNNAANVTGTIVGGIAGAALGNQVGGGLGRDLATGAGAVAGAAAGNAITNSATTVQSFEWTIRLESGQTISVIQASPTFSVGQRVQVIQSGSNTRLAAA
jgi:outer membrane lipoprotein SlyB